MIISEHQPTKQWDLKALGKSIKNEKKWIKRVANKSKQKHTSDIMISSEFDQEVRAKNFSSRIKFKDSHFSEISNDVLHMLTTYFLYSSDSTYFYA